jgi:choline dehydrogenase
MLFQATLVLLVLQASTVASVPAERRAIPIADQTFDYVVVGGGTAGSVIATRLAQNDFDVALIEAGGYYELGSVAEFPAAAALTMGSDPDFSSPVDWGFVTRDQPGANMRAIHVTRGKCLGGS